MLRWSRLWQPVLLRAVVPLGRGRGRTRFASTKPAPKRLRAFQPAASAVGMFDRSLMWAVYVWAGFVAWHTWAHYFYTCASTYGISMLPTLSSFGDWVVISKWYRRGRGVQVGDLVSFHHPVKEGEYAIKRVMGLSGDLVLMYTPGKSDAMMQVPEGHCWVVGDNLAHSRDSRHFGPLPLALVAGKVIGKIDWQGWIPQLAAFENGLQPALEDDID